MKKILFASSAIVAVAFAGQASASEPIKLSVGGYMEQWIGFADEDAPGTAGRVNAFQSDTEVYFSGSTTLDNGIEIGARIELEGETSDDQIDEQFLFVNGGFGRIELGKNDSAADSMAISAPRVGPVGPNDGGIEDWYNEAGVIDTAPSSGDQNRVTYFTPSLGGFQAGVSFADDSGQNDASGNGDNIVSAAIAYDADFDGFSLGLSVEGENQDEDDWYGAGVNVGFGNFTVGGSYGHVEPDAGEETDAFDLGVSYAMDAASVSATYAYQEEGDEELQAASVGLNYTLGAGVSWQSSVFWFDEESATDNEGYGVVTGIALNF